MKFPVGEIPDPEIPEPEFDEFDEFGDRIIHAIISSEYVDEGGRTIQIVDNLHEWTTYTKQLSRNRDARMLERGEIDQAGLRRKNDAFHGVDFSKVRIVSIGGKPYEDID